MRDARGSTDRRSTDRRSTDRGSTDRGSTDRGSTDRGSTDRRGGMTVRRRPSLARRVFTLLVTLPLMAAVVIVNRPIVGVAAERYHEFTINRQSYKQQFGHWSLLHVPGKFKVNAVHAALLRTGKVLIIAGSGNDREKFEAGTFRTILWDPRTDTFKDVATPTDLFCAGHTFLPNGNLLVAGGTKSYEVLAADITHAAGVMKIKNESPDSGPHTFAKGTRLLSSTGRVYLTRAEVTVPAATKMTHGSHTTGNHTTGNHTTGSHTTGSHTTMVHAGEAEVWVDAADPGDAAIVTEPAQYAVEGLAGDDAKNLYGIAEKITRDKQEYGGDKTSYEFDPVAERYVRTGDMVRHRWYPTLATMPGGDVLAVSGLDEFGRMLPGVNERYQVAERRWVPAPGLRRVFPTYPALFLTEDEKLFFSGSNAGYGSDTEGRTPGLWDVATNEFTTVPGLTDPGMTETSASVLLPPAQEQKVMILGGGAVGDSPISTARTAIADLRADEPRYRPGPDLPAPTRYLNTVVLPDDTVFTSGGSSGYRGGPYRGRTRSDLLTAHLYDPRREVFREAAAPDVGRNYHAEALLLPDGRVVTMGSDPIYDATGKNPGRFEQRIEIYSPPYLFQGDRPSVGGGPRTLKHGRTAAYATGDADRIVSARLVRPSAVTHGTDVDQRSVELDVRRTPGGVTVQVPEKPGLVPSGWYMLFLIDGDGVPSRARWVRVA